MGAFRISTGRGLQRFERNGSRGNGSPLRHFYPGNRVALRAFKSVKRRLEVKAEINGITIIDDFAHHPTAIAETLKALRTRYNGRRLWAVLEPRSNTLRRNVFQRELVQSLRLADRVVLAGIFKSEAIPERERLEPADVIAELQQQGTPAEIASDGGRDHRRHCSATQARRRSRHIVKRWLRRNL